MAGSGEKAGKSAAAGGIGKASRGPRGTRDFYVGDMLKRRYIESMWREVAIRHGFEEIDGPRFEHLELYTIKSGEGIVSELFSFTREGGADVYALRPEFTPTLARMVAARASSLPKPVKWFSVGPYFRAERPQRGRLREFLQWNVDIVGDDSPEADAELIACCVDFLRALKLTEEDVRIRMSDRGVVASLMRKTLREESNLDEAIALWDRFDRLSQDELEQRASALGWDLASFRARVEAAEITKSQAAAAMSRCAHCADWLDVDLGIVRGLAYYTGAVFEVHEAAGKERAIAGGGRYDNLVELFGGPATPAVGFAMGDVVLANVLEDKGLMPSEAELRDRFGYAPDAFVIPGDGADDVMERVSAVVAALRAGAAHARKSYRATRNAGKLLSEADKAGAHFALIAHSDGRLERKQLRSDGSTGEAGARIDAIAQAQGWTVEEA